MINDPLRHFRDDAYNLSGQTGLGLEEPLALPNSNTQLDRMTINYKKRLDGIKSSLQIWKENIVKNIGVKFYKHFRKSYLYYLYKGFFLRAIQHRQLIKAFYFYLHSPKKLTFLIEILKGLIKRIHSRKSGKQEKTKEEILKPTFIPFRD